MQENAPSPIIRITDGILKLDWKAIFLSIWLPVGLWIFLVFIVTLDGFAGIFCVTPLIWLFALTIGLRCQASSRKEKPTLDAAVAGGLFGLSIGIVNVVASLFIGDPVYGYLPMLTIAGCLFALVGTPVCGVLAYLIVRWKLKRKEQAPPPS